MIVFTRHCGESYLPSPALCGPLLSGLISYHLLFAPSSWSHWSSFTKLMNFAHLHTCVSAQNSQAKSRTSPKYFSLCGAHSDLESQWGAPPNCYCLYIHYFSCILLTICKFTSTCVLIYACLSCETAGFKRDKNSVSLVHLGNSGQHRLSALFME